jgi:hypothetical protein
MIRNLLRALALTAILAVAGNHDANAQAPNYVCQIVMSGAGVSNATPAGVCAIDPTRMTNGAGVGLLLNFSSGASATASVQVTGDVPVNVTSGGLWNNHDTLVNETANANGNIQFPVTAVRLNVTAYASGTVTLTVIQPAIPK